MQVELLWVELQDVPRRACDQHRTGRTERLAQLGDAHLQRRAARIRRLLAPQVVDEPVGRHDLVNAQQQNREQRALLGARQRHQRVAVGDLERAEDPEVHRVSRPLADRRILSQDRSQSGDRYQKGRVMRLATRSGLITTSLAIAAIAAPNASAGSGMQTSTLGPVGGPMSSGPTILVRTVPSSGFDYGDAAIGAGVLAGVTLLGAPARSRSADAARSGTRSGLNQRTPSTRSTYQRWLPRCGAPPRSCPPPDLRCHRRTDPPR